MGKRRAKSSVVRLPAEQRAFIEQLLREDRLTLDEMIAAIQGKFPGQPAADLSRSALHRYSKPFAELVGRMRDIDRAADALVGELGEGVGEKSGQLLAQAITTLATNAALNAQEQELSVDEIRKLARAAKDAIDTRRISLAERQQIEKAARERLQREQDATLKAVVKEGGLSDEMADVFRKKILGIG